MINNEENNRKIREEMEEKREELKQSFQNSLFTFINIFKKSVIYLSIAFLVLLCPYKGRKEKKDKVRKQSQIVSRVCNHREKGRKYKSSASQN